MFSNNQKYFRVTYI